MAISKIETESLDTALNAPTATALSTASGSAPSYSARAWVNFNGTGTVAIRASGNVSSITDNGTGDYTVNFTTTMANANYSFALNGKYGNGEYGMQYGMQSVTTTAIRVSQIYTNGAYYDAPYFCVEIFR